MGWQINCVHNDVFIPEEQRRSLEDIVEPEGHYIDYANDGTICFDDDAMEWKDFVWHDSVLNLFSEFKANGQIIFNSNDGDNAGEYWGYHFNEGQMTKLDKKTCLLYLASLED